MKSIHIDVTDEREATAIQRAMADPETRAFVVIVGTLLPFSDRARARILTFVADSVRDPYSPLRVELLTYPVTPADELADGPE
jgi:hypothetical protein